MTTPVPHDVLMTTLSIAVSAHATGKPVTATSLSRHLPISHDTAMRHREQLIELGLIALVKGRSGALLLQPTASAMALDLPPPPPSRRPAPPERARRPRSCMRCTRSFLSDGAHHRHCDRCRRQLSDLDSASAF